MYSTAKLTIYGVQICWNWRELGSKWMGERYITRPYWKAASIGAAVTSCGRVFNRQLPTTGNASLPTVKIHRIIKVLFLTRNTVVNSPEVPAVAVTTVRLRPVPPAVSTLHAASQVVSWSPQPTLARWQDPEHASQADWFHRGDRRPPTPTAYWASDSVMKQHYIRTDCICVIDNFFDFSLVFPKQL